MNPDTLPPRVLPTDATRQFIDQLRARYGDLIFFQSGGCCDGSTPMCYKQGEFHLGDDDICLGIIHGVPFYMGPDQFEYWKHTQLIIDVVKGNGGMFSLDNGTGQRFLVRSRLFGDDEWQLLSTHQPEKTLRVGYIRAQATAG